jgi:hypothetical protein
LSGAQYRFGVAIVIARLISPPYCVEEGVLRRFLIKASSRQELEAAVKAIQELVETE